MTLFPVLVDVYHKEQLVTKEEAEKVATDVGRWAQVAVTKDVSSATRIADILNQYGYSDVTEYIDRERVYSCLCV